MKVLAVIPARYASSRFPGKPLARLGDRPVIQWVWEHVCQLSKLSRIIVATDDSRIYQAVSDFGGEAMMTSTSHRSGTDRCGEVVRSLQDKGEFYDVVINVQGDEPFVQPAQLQTLVDCFFDAQVQIATLRTRIQSTEELLSPNNVKVICNRAGKALYFSRQPIPYLRGVDSDQWIEREAYYKHVGIYAFRSDALLSLTKLQSTTLEQAESLEQLRWLECGYSIAVQTTLFSNVGIDTPEDLDAAARMLKSVDSYPNLNKN
ncbi:MAG: 3-deoxy-manno-octulosonate cytidylyltransferase [Bacteroidales bacterium]|nr:3-deoxy-manno-octulosonate cytidylyltransferase [Bacteroidales bacterium]